MIASKSSTCSSHRQMLQMSIKKKLKFELILPLIDVIRIEKYQHISKWMNLRMSKLQRWANRSENDHETKRDGERKGGREREGGKEWKKVWVHVEQPLSICNLFKILIRNIERGCSNV